MDSLGAAVGMGPTLSAPTAGIGADLRIGQYLRIAAEAPSPLAPDSPHALAASFAAAINAGDVPGALELWVEDPSLVQADGNALQGRDAIAPALQALVDNRIRFSAELTRVFVAGDVALGVGTLTMSSTDGDGASFEQSSSSVVVYVRNPDGEWRIAIDAPWGLPEGGNV